MFADTEWYLSVITVEDEGETVELTCDLLEELEDEEELMPDSFYALLMMFRTVLRFQSDGKLTVLVTLDDDELEDPDYQRDFVITDDGCILAGEYTWSMQNGALCVDAEFLRNMSPSDDKIADGMHPLCITEDGKLVLFNDYYFERLD